MLWLIIGVILGLLAAFVFVQSRAGKLRVRWYQLVLGVVAAVFILLAIQNYFALQDELEPKLATFTMMAFGLPGVVSAALIWLIPMVTGRARKGEPTPQPKTA